jgi:hypothetical protein
MADLPLAFTWEAPANRDGFDLVEVPLPDAPLAPVCQALKPAPVTQRRYRVFEEETGLFRTLADTPGGAAEILRFANTYGLLGIGTAVPAEEVGAHGETILYPHTALLPLKGKGWETVPNWRLHIRWLRALVDLWDLARAGGVDALGRALAWDDAGVTLPDLPSCELFWRDKRRRILPTAKLRGYGVGRGDLAGAAHAVLTAVLNTQLLRAPTALVWDPGLRRPSLGTQVDSLWGAVCLQFAAAIAGDKNYGKCKGCGRWFELAPGINIASRLTCSAACRQMLYRGRVDRARELHAEGKSATEIAQEVGSSVEAVRRWVAGKKE